MAIRAAIFGVAQGALQHLLEQPRAALRHLEALTQGDSEKQIAAKLNVSPHTVHVHVKKLYKRLNVSSRGELVARFVRGQ